MELAKVISKGQIRIPVMIRNKLQLKTGDKDFEDVKIDKPLFFTPARYFELIEK